MRRTSRIPLLPLALAMGIALSGTAEAARYQLNYKVQGIEKRLLEPVTQPSGDCTSIEGSGGTVSQVTLQGLTYQLHAFTGLGASRFSVS